MYFFLLTYKYPNNEHKNDSANGQRVNFERVVYVSELVNEKDMEDDDLPLDLLRLITQEERRILPYRETTNAVNLGIEEERKEVKIGASLTTNTKKELVELLQEYNNVFVWSY